MAEQNEQQVQPDVKPLGTSQDNDPYSDTFEKQVAGLHQHILNKAGKAEKPEEKPAEQPQAAVAPAQQPEQAKPITATNAELPSHLVTRARQFGWSDDRINKYDGLTLERALNDMEATLATALRQHMQQPTQQPQQQPVQPVQHTGPEQQPKAEEKLDLWKGIKREDVDEPLANALDRLVEFVTKSRGDAALAAKVEEMQRALVEQGAYLRDHAEQSRAATIDKIGDRLADLGYADIFGKGRSKPGTVAHENKGLLANFLSATMQSYAQFGMSGIDLDEIAEMFARQRWGVRQQQSAQQQQPVQQPIYNGDPNSIPRGQRPNPRDEKRPTGVARPTAREPQRPTGREAAISTVNGLMRGWEGGLELGDIHDS